MKIQPELLQKIKDSVNLVELIGEQVVLKKKGANYEGLCPFHNERSPSFSVSETKQFFHCFGCKESGDIISYLTKSQGLSFYEALEELSERGGVALPKEFGLTEEASQEMNERKSALKEKTSTALKLNRFAAKFFRDELSKNSSVRSYFVQRGISELISQNFYLGASPAKWDELSSYLMNAKAPLELASELGLIKPSEKKQADKDSTKVPYFDLFRNRAMFPILDLKGKVVGFGGRGGLPLPKGAPDIGDGNPKYLNSSDSFVFNKSKVLYGLFQAQKHIREKGCAIIVEGYFDVLAMHQAGFENTVATCGTALTPEHLKLLTKIAPKIICLFDSDRAGKMATDRAMEVGLEQGQVLFGMQLVGAKDPDEFLFDQATGILKPDSQVQMKKLIEESQAILDLRLESAYRYSLQGLEAKTRALKQVSQWMSLYQDPIGKEIRLSTLKRRFELDESLMKALFYSSTKGTAKAFSVETRNSPSTQKNDGLKSSSGVKTNALSQRMSARDRILLRGLSRGGEYLSLFKSVEMELPPQKSLEDLCTHADFKLLVQELVSGRTNPSDLLNVSTDPELRSIISETVVIDEVQSKTQIPFLSTGDFNRALDRSLVDLWAQFSHQLEERLLDAESKQDKDLAAKILQEILDVKRRIKELVSSYDEA